MDFNFSRPMLNTPTKDDDVGQRWLQKVLTRLRKFRVNDTKIPMLLNMANENERVEREARGAI
jgi:hypothetical protein